VVGEGRVISWRFSLFKAEGCMRWQAGSMMQLATYLVKMRRNQQWVQGKPVFLHTRKQTVLSNVKLDPQFATEKDLHVYRQN
jgi:hypothetical protein